MFSSASASVRPFGRSLVAFVALAISAFLPLAAGAQTNTFAANPQHTSVYPIAAQNLNRIKWTYDIDLNNSGQFAHYGAPLVTLSNTIITPVKTATNGFEVHALNPNGTLKYMVASDLILPTHNWIPVFQPVIATSTFGTRMYYGGAGGTIWYIDNPDSATPGTPTRQVFYGTEALYLSDQANFNSTVFVDGPITADSDGNVFFCFRVQGTAPAPLSTTQSGIARIDPSGNATYVLAGNAAADLGTPRTTHNLAPALSNDESLLYVVVKHPTSAFGGYILALDTTTLATVGKVRVKDPRNGNDAGFLDDGTASPMVAPDGDVYLGVFGNPNAGSRGFLARFSGDLNTTKTFGGFGWDYTPGLIDAALVPEYTGPSSYLLFAKYNNYSFSDGNGVNRVAVLDPNTTQTDYHTTALGLVQMREVFTAIGPVRDATIPSNPIAVREWCINAPSINPPHGAIIVPCEDGRLYKWDLATNSLTQALVLNSGLGQPYVPTVIGPDGTVYVLNGGTLFACGDLDGVAVEISSSEPDMRSVVVGDSITFTATVTNTGAGSEVPTGSITFESLTYDGVTPVITPLGTVPLDGSGVASVTTSSLTAGGTFLGSHIVTATYSGDANFNAGSMALQQKVHAFGTTTAVTTPGTSNFGDDFVVSATVTSGGGTPTGQVLFTEGATILG